MKDYLVLFVLFGSLIFTSCSVDGDAKEDEIEYEESQTDSNGEQNIENDMEEIVDADVKLIWKTYTNERFGFCAEYPSNFLTPTGESENHDGNTFANANGSSEMRASGIYNALDETIAEAFERATENDVYYDEEKKITYKFQMENWFLISGNYNESIFYLKSVLVEDTFYTLYFEYHSSEEEQFDQIIKHVMKDFPDC